MSGLVASKRPRSPSPAGLQTDDGLSSPLGVLLKRRRRDELVLSHGWGEAGPSSSSPLRPAAASNTVAATPPPAPGVERRRARQWERLQAPAVAHGDGLDSPENMRGAHHQYMSSSPIRHQHPHSSPFRESEWTQAEREEQWGVEYASGNSLLHALHMSRQSAQIHGPSVSTPHQTPAQLFTDTSDFPFATIPPYGTLSHATTPLHTTTPHHLPTPFRTTQPTPQAFASSPYLSPFAQPGSGPPDEHGSPGGMQIDVDSPAEVDAKRGYEEANRLLAELEFARRTRWEGDGLRT